ncbi:hypothetical protein CLOM_g2016 [Closterium sp. NIES-68]|nr:hypothetical protein CLOM_g2016 [Closterium sp. NIES-68]
MLKPAEHQVAGHRFEEGRQGSLVDDSGCFYKPMQAGERGEKELNFYNKIAADESIPAEIKAMFPACHGSKEVLLPPAHTPSAALAAGAAAAASASAAAAVAAAAGQGAEEQLTPVNIRPRFLHALPVL